MWLNLTWLSEWHCSAVWGYPDTADGVAAGGRAWPSADQEAQRDGADVEERGWVGKSWIPGRALKALPRDADQF